MSFEGISNFLRTRKILQTTSEKGFEDIGEFVKARQASDPVEQIGLVEAVSRYLEGMKDDDRLPGFHVSKISYKFCPVQHVLSKITPKAVQIPYRLRYRFDVGTALHHMVQRYFADMGILKGYWKCSNGHTTTEISLKPDKCPTCGDKKLRYKEICLRYEIKPGYEIVGHTDGVLFWQNEDMGFEMKSLEPNVLSWMNKPYAYPIVQLNIYMHLLRMKMFPNMRKGIVLLVAPMDKDSILIPMKSFYIDYTDSYWQDAYKKVSQAVEFEEAFNNGTLTPQTLVASRVCPTRAYGVKAECEQLTPCFDTSLLVKEIKAAYAARAQKSGT